MELQRVIGDETGRATAAFLLSIYRQNQAEQNRGFYVDDYPVIEGGFLVPEVLRSKLLRVALETAIGQHGGPSIEAEFPSPVSSEGEFVYVIQAVGKNGVGPIKIGVAKNVPKRLKQLRTGTPWRLRILGTVEGARVLETHLHERLWESRKRGEWFTQTDEVMGVVRIMQRRDITNEEKVAALWSF